ncbi:Protein farnesyltransferase subunit beta [Entamoeba marina]
MQQESEIITKTSQDQSSCEQSVANEKRYKQHLIDKNFLEYGFNSKIHIKWLIKSITNPLSSSFESLDASTPWLLYWTLNALRLLKHDVTQYLEPYTESFRLITLPDGVIRGSQQIIPITAGCYSGICAMIKKNTYDFLTKRKFPDGSFEMNEDSGDVDTRACFCAMSTAYVLNILDDNLKRDTAEWILSCQTYEGGFSGCPGGEAHGGYSYCAVAALALLGRIDDMNIPKFLRWLMARQLVQEGGFNGRINKLVDSCYTFWQVSTFAILFKYSNSFKQLPVFPDVEKLLDYIILACQKKDGGFCDKPTKRADLYHTNYSLSGISAILHTTNHPLKDELCPIEPTMGVDQSLFDQACNYFKSLSPIF